jgi:hypothetical protein
MGVTSGVVEVSVTSRGGNHLWRPQAFATFSPAPSTGEKVRKTNYERIFDEVRHRVRGWKVGPRRFQSKRKDRNPALGDLTLGRPATRWAETFCETSQRIHPKEARCWRARRRSDLPRYFAFAQANEIVHSVVRPIAKLVSQ